MKEIVFLVVMDIVVIASMFGMYKIGQYDGRVEGREETLAQLDGKI